MILRAISTALSDLELREQKLLVAVSGGVDSTVLFHALSRCARRHRLELVIGHVNHGLRGRDADADEDAVRALGEKFDTPVVATRVDPEALRMGRASRARPTLQEAARRARYDALESAATRVGASRIATGHTLDDQAETVMLRLLRGAGPDALGGIPERSHDGRVVRPLLSVPRAEILAYARARGLSWREDPSNANPRFARSRLRRPWLPGLARAFNPQLLRAIAHLAEAQRRDSEWIAAMVEREAERRFWTEGTELRIARDGWVGLPEALARRLARLAFHRAGMGRDVSRTHIQRMLEFLRSGRVGSSIQLPGGKELARDRGEFRLRASGVRNTAAC